MPPQQVAGAPTTGCSGLHPTSPGRLPQQVLGAIPTGVLRSTHNMLWEARLHREASRRVSQVGADTIPTLFWSRGTAKRPWPSEECSNGGQDDVLVILSAVLGKYWLYLGLNNIWNGWTLKGLYCWCSTLVQACQNIFNLAPKLLKC